MKSDEQTARRRRSWYAASAKLTRWLHTYLSMISFATLLFFAATGLTLNHPTWFGADEVVLRDEQGSLPTSQLVDDLDKLALAEEFRDRHHLKGKVTEFEVSDFDCLVTFKSAGYVADVFVDRETGNYTVSETSSGAIAIMNDLHKGRDTGQGWSWVIDISAILMVLVSVTGLVLLLFLKRQRAVGLVITLLGSVLLLVAWLAWVP